MPQATQVAALVPHVSTPSKAVRSLVVHWERDREGLRLRYVLEADVARLRLPPPGEAGRRDGLWRHTCFELFVAAVGTHGYREFNFSPSGDWAAYAFARYRHGAEPLDCAAPGIGLRRSPGGLELEVAVACLPRGMLRVGFAAVVEEAGGALSCWALCHPSRAPDFHHAEAFALKLDEARH